MQRTVSKAGRKRKLAILACAVALSAAATSRFAGASPWSVRLDHGSTKAKHQIETMPGGVALLDYDGDQRLDVFFVNGAAPNRLYRNQGAGRFEDVTANAAIRSNGFGMAAATADYDNDGHADILVAGVGFVQLLRNTGAGRFEDVTRTAGLEGNSLAANARWSIGAGWFDYDRDGDLDLFVVRYVQWDPKTEPACEDVTSGLRTYCHPRFYAPLSNLLYRNDGDGTFRDVSAASGIAAHKGKGMSVTFGDFDGDGWLDVFVANDTVPNFLFRNKGDGTFEETGLAAGVGLNDDGNALSSMGADARDLDGDGREDIFVSALANESFPLFRNLRGGTFLDTTYATKLGGASLPYSGWGAGAFDFDNDGHRDVFVAAGDVQDNTELFSSRKSKQPCLLFGKHAGGSYRLQTFGELSQWRGAAFGDIDNDGRVDAVVTRLGGTPVLWRNLAKAGNWIGFRLRGATTNRQGLGAMVKIETASGAQWNRATTAVGYASASDSRVHFGLGRATGVSGVEVTWTDGKVQRLGAMPAGRYFDIAEASAR